MKTTDYFDVRVRLGRPYIKIEWCEHAIKHPDHKLLQPDGRMRYYKYIEEVEKFIRVIVLEDGETLHNAFFDRKFTIKRH